MKVAIITDQHFGARKNSKLFHDYFLKFYNDVFFPTLEKEGITTVIDMGDTFDSRKGIDFAALTWAKDNYFDRLKELGCTVHTIVGNHTAYYKNTNDINAVDLLLREYDNVKIYAETQEVKLGDTKVLFVPWINNENEEETFKRVKKSNCKVVMGHLELNVYKPMIAYNILQSIKLLSDGCNSFVKNCISGIKLNKKMIDLHLNNSLMLVTSLTPVIGYDKAAEIAKKAHKNGTTLKEEAIKLKYISEKEYDKIVRPEKMIKPS